MLADPPTPASACRQLVYEEGSCTAAMLGSDSSKVRHLATIVRLRHTRGLLQTLPNPPVAHLRG
jgi:hypothetical protein